MAVLQMEQVHLVAMKRDRKKILELIQRRGVVEVRDADGEDEIFAKADTSQTQALFEKSADTAEKAVEIVSRYVPEKKPALAFLAGRTAVSLEVHDAFYAQQDEVLRTAQRVVQCDREIAEAKAEVLRTEAQQEALVPWMSLPFAQTFSGTKKTAVFVGSVDGEMTLEALYAALAAAAPELDALHIEVVSTSKEQTCFYVIVPKQDEVKAEDALRTIGFARPPSATHYMPAEKRERLEEQKKEATDRIAEAEEAIRATGDRRDDFRMLGDHMRMRAEKYGVIEKLSQSKHVFVLDGYVPAACAYALVQELNDRFECSVQVGTAQRADEVPVKLKNNKFAEPAEAVLESYSLPGKEDVDPTNVMSIFYYIMFGMMFSDAGYGLIMAGVCLACLLIFKNMEPSWKRNLKMFFWCGVSTIFWGVMFSSYFGDVITVVSGNFFGHAIVIPPLWISPLEQPMLLLMFCLGVGIVHLSAGMVLKAKTLVQNKQYIDILYDVVFSLMAVYPLILALMASDMFAGMSGFKLPIPSTAITVLMGVAGAGVLGTLLTAGRESKNWFKRLLKGAYGLYNVLAGWLGDILSYSRLLALGLATGVIASVINTMGAMIGTGVFAFIIFIVIFCAGHALNFGINVLGAYVHSNRLEFVEFFGKFYEGGGQKFEPFGIHTKYYKIEEEAQNV